MEKQPKTQLERISEFLKSHPELETFTSKIIKEQTGIQNPSTALGSLVKRGLEYQTAEMANGGLFYVYTNPFYNNGQNDKDGPDYKFIWEQCKDLHHGTLAKNGYAHYVLGHLPIFRRMPEYYFIKAKRKWKSIYPGLPCPFDVDLFLENGDKETKDDELEGMVHHLADQIISFEDQFNAIHSRLEQIESSRFKKKHIRGRPSAINEDKISDQEILTLSDQGLSLADIGRKLGCTRQNIYGRLQKLHHKMDDVDIGVPELAFGKQMLLRYAVDLLNKAIK